MAAPGIRPLLLMADQDGNIFEHPELHMVCRQGNAFSLPRPDEMMPLPEESELFLLPGRRAIGLNPETGELETQEETAVAAFVSPAHTLSGHAAYVSDENAPTLPLFAYGAVGFANGRFYVCAKRVDADKRQVFCDIPPAVIKREAKRLISEFPKNRLMQHLMHKCALTYACPAARNLNIDPELYLGLLKGIDFGPAMGLNNFRKRILKECPWVRFGYFNPYLPSIKTNASSNINSEATPNAS